MDDNTICVTLKRYRENKAKVRCGELEIEGIKEYLRSGMHENIEEQDETIESMCVPAKSLSNTPSGKTNKFYSIVEDVALNYRNEWAKKPPTKAELMERINNIMSRIYPIRQEVKLVEEVMLPCLSDKERFIIECLYIDGYSWNDITKMYAEKFEAREESTLKDIRRFAIKKIARVLS